MRWRPAAVRAWVVTWCRGEEEEGHGRRRSSAGRCACGTASSGFCCMRAASNVLMLGRADDC